MELDNNAHSVFLLHYHLMLAVKYRKKVFDENMSARAKEIFEYISPNYNITLIEWNQDKDYVHILFTAHPNSEIREHFWSQSFCLLTTGRAPMDVIKKYIESQGEKY